MSAIYIISFQSYSNYMLDACVYFQTTVEKYTYDQIDLCQIYKV